MRFLYQIVMMAVINVQQAQVPVPQWRSQSATPYAAEIHHHPVALVSNYYPPIQCLSHTVPLAVFLPKSYLATVAKFSYPYIDR